MKPTKVPLEKNTTKQIGCPKGQPILFYNSRSRIIPFSLRIYCNKIFFFPFLFKIKLYRSDAMLEFSFSIKEKNLNFLYSKF